MCGVLITLSAGCSSPKEKNNAGEKIELMDPADIGVTYEVADCRNRYDSQVLSATVIPYIEEYRPGDNLTVQNINAFPGDEVKKGDILVEADPKAIDDQIKATQKNIENMDKQYEEYVKMQEDQLKQKRTSLNNLQGYMDAYNRNPDGYDQDVANVQLIGPYKTLAYSIESIEVEMRQHKELYDLDRAQAVKNLNNLKKNKQKLSVVSGMDGVVVGQKSEVSQGSYLSKDESVIAVADMSQKLLRCEYVNSSKMRKAKEVYAVINGKRYEVEYQLMDSDEYTTLTAKGENVYTTFHLLGAGDEVEIGSFAVVVLINDVKENVLSVPKEAIGKDELGSYVYILDNAGNTSQSYVSLGMSDGVYTEILSGVNPEDKIVFDTTMKTGKKTEKLQVGDFNTKFEGKGSLSFPITEWVTNTVENGSVYFKEFKIDSYFQHVQKGDVLATVRVVGDDVALARNQTKRNRIVERINDLKKNEKDNEKQIAAMQEQLEEIDKIIAKQKADFATTEIKAPISGYISNVGIADEEEQFVSSGRNIVQIAKENACFIMAVDEGGLLQYGDEVKVAYEINGKKSSVDGKVVSITNMALSKNVQSENAYIQIPMDNSQEIAMASLASTGWGGNRTPYTITATTRQMNNVLVVPKKAVKESKGCTYVYVKDASGKITAQSFIAGGYNADYYWVVGGLTEGMEVCLE